MTQKGKHTWDMVYTYHRCPKCGYVQLERKDSIKLLNLYQKEILCNRCKERYIDLCPPYPAPDNY